MLNIVTSEKNELVL